MRSVFWIIAIVGLSCSAFTLAVQIGNAQIIGKYNDPHNQTTNQEVIDILRGFQVNAQDGDTATITNVSNNDSAGYIYNDMTNSWMGDSPNGGTGGSSCPKDDKTCTEQV
jgi:hypothetical protein